IPASRALSNSFPHRPPAVNRPTALVGTRSGQPVAWQTVTDPTTNLAEPARLTQETYDRLQAELEDLTTRGRVEIAQAIEAARALGDLSENGDYHAAKETQGKMEV